MDKNRYKKDNNDENWTNHENERKLIQMDQNG